MQTILVVGGAGYIGSHTVKRLLISGRRVVVIDNLSTGSLAAIPKEVIFYNIDLLDKESLARVFSTFKFAGLFHFAAKLSVPESFEYPFEYFENNIVGTMNLLEMCARYEVGSFIFSSTAAVYGDVSVPVVDESHILNPQNPYGLSKKMAEELIIQYAKINPKFHYQILRYFNVSGAELDASNGPRNINSGQLIVNLCKSALGDRVVKVFGHSFDTKDGSAIRDFIHVGDLAQAHIHAFEKIVTTSRSGIWNCGYGVGYSVLEVIKAFEKSNKLKFEVRFHDARIGDPVKVVANNSLLTSESSWSPKYADIELICKTTYEWISKIHKDS